MSSLYQTIQSSMSGALRISNLLNPDDTPLDAAPLLSQLLTLSGNKNSLLVPPEIHNHLRLAAKYLEEISEPAQTTPSIPRVHPVITQPRCREVRRTTAHNIRITRETTLDVLYTYPVGAVVEYPEASSTGYIGHLFQIDPSKWSNPVLDVAYSRGTPSGQTPPEKAVYTKILRSSITNKAVPCIRSHTTCQGSKICPYSDTQLVELPHTSASLADVKERLQNDREQRSETSSPSKDVFLRTVAYLAAIQKLGCSRPLSEQTFFLASEEEERQTREIYLQQVQRGYRMPGGICEGRLVFSYSETDAEEPPVPYVCCEHYVPGKSKDHFHDWTVGGGAYDIAYIEAVITGDLEESARIEDEAGDKGYGPAVECTTVSNFSSQRAFCPVPHRNAAGLLVQSLLQHLPCTSKFRVYEPLEEHRSSCPYILLITTDAHTHPVPLPTKTPPNVRENLMGLLGQMVDDLADLTARRFLRHPILKSFLSGEFPNLINPTLADWHVSLANREHVKSYIKQAQEIHYPFGTGWKGVINLKSYQDTKLPKEHHYIRRTLALPAHSDPTDSDDEEFSPQACKDDRLRIIVCMTPEASRRLLASGRYLQSDIGFRRIIGFKEFEVASMDRDANTSIIYCRIYLNRMTAQAHQRVFEEIEGIVLEDTGKRLQWHHLHATSLEDGLDSMILSWTADQHRGQAKGLGLHLQKLASCMPPKRDMYETERLLQDLSPYEHLHRNFRLCATTEQVRWLMRSLVCMEHPDWDGTIQMISVHGGKAAQDWLQNKESSGFVFEGICWQKSRMLRQIWEAGDNNSNLIETTHRDVNREGVQCTLVGGLKKGWQFDAMKMKTLKAFESYGITPTHKSTHISANALSNLKRRDNHSHRQLVAEDVKIAAWNQKFQTASDSLVKAGRAVDGKRRQLSMETDLSMRVKVQQDLDKKLRTEVKARAAWEKLVALRASLTEIGSGKVGLLDPMTTARD
ncbi:hypothetical protein C8R45DRAFT_938748 [Mycena sanguinolenta]|nr:hypothetical protein C8R45DRAFT_938748 [Mycena sanguinolenta]